MPFREISGHRALLAMLARAIARDTLPASLIFSGPEGVGKRLSAGAVAETTNCPQAAPVSGFERDACGVCTACRRIARGIHPDVLTLQPGDTGSIKIDAVRETLSHANYRPFEGRYRVVIIDPADAMAAEAQSALLKSLEEPPPSSRFLLVTARPDVLLPTVRSRCPQVRFGRLGPAEVAEVLVRAHGVPDAEARAAAAASDGSPGRALAARTRAPHDIRALVWRVLQGTAGAAPPRHPAPMPGRAEPGGARRLESAKMLASKRAGSSLTERDELVLRLETMLSLLRDMQVMVVGADRRRVANADLDQDLARLASVFGRDRTLQAFAAVSRAREAVDRNASPKVVADWLAFQI
jgi:DNA polymerase III delta' subunit